mmetsp:Transcript_95866/g.310739  ORF Transcript_95866/g.310739 Transcript_95866/m.310739 type:complete len:216 (+) Transcript_95866:945-1592(+)
MLPHILARAASADSALRTAEPADDDEEDEDGCFMNAGRAHAGIRCEDLIGAILADNGVRGLSPTTVAELDFSCLPVGATPGAFRLASASTVSGLVRGGCRSGGSGGGSCSRPSSGVKLRLAAAGASWARHRGWPCAAAGASWKPCCAEMTGLLKRADALWYKVGSNSLSDRHGATRRSTGVRLRLRMPPLPLDVEAWAAPPLLLLPSHHGWSALS